MKKTFLLFFLCALMRSYGQQTLAGNNYITITEDIKTTLLKSDGTKASNDQYAIKKGTKFSVAKITKEGLIIKFLPYDGAPGVEEQARIKALNDTKDKDKAFIDQNLKGKAKTKAKKGNRKAYTKSLHDPSLVIITPPTQVSPASTSPSVPQIYIGKWANDGEFLIDVAELNNCKLYYGKANQFVWGLLTLPVKLRFGNGSGSNPQPFRFEENLNLGISAGYQRQLPGTHQQSLNVLAAASISRVSVDSTSFRTKQPNSGSQVAAFSASVGLLYQYELFQIGIFAGWDVLGSNLEYQWKYKNAPWIGLGLGVSLFNINKTTPGTGSN